MSEATETKIESPKLAYVIRSVDKDRRSHGGFQWPESGPVEAPDFVANKECGAGLHGLLNGIGDWSLTHCEDASRIWQVVAVDSATIIELDGKVKFPRGEVVYSGPLPGAMKLIAERRLLALAAKEPSTTGYGAPASTAGDYAPASTAGDYAPASTTGNHAPASTTGYGAPASTTGDYAPASTAGNHAPASTAGNHAPASTTGDYAPASTTGNHAPASTAGYHAPASTAGYRAPASTTGNRAPASTTGNHAPASTTGYGAPASTTGDYAPASTAGDYAPASTTGKNSVAACLGSGGRAKCGELGSIILTRWDESSKRHRHAVGYAGEGGIEPGVWYVLDDSGAITRAEDQS